MIRSPFMRDVARIRSDVSIHATVAYAVRADGHAAVRLHAHNGAAEADGRAAHVDHDRVLQRGKIAGAANGVRRAAGHRENGVAVGVLHGHEGIPRSRKCARAGSYLLMKRRPNSYLRRPMN